MKKVIAGVVAGIVLGISGTVVAATGYWQQDGRDYSCSGVGNGVICISGRYKVGVTPSFVFIQHRSSGWTYACRKRMGITTCSAG